MPWISPERQAELDLARRGVRVLGPQAAAQAARTFGVPLPTVARVTRGAFWVGGALAVVWLVSRLTERAVR